MQVEHSVALVTGGNRGIGEAARACGDISILINGAGAFHSQTPIGATDLALERSMAKMLTAATISTGR